MNFRSAFKTIILCQLSELTVIAFRATRNLEDNMLPVNYRCWKTYLLELPESWNTLCFSSTVGSTVGADNRSFQRKFCQQSELTYLLNAVFLATKILLPVGLDIPINHSFQSYQNPANRQSWNTCQLSELTNVEDVKPRRHIASRQISELPKKLKLSASHQLSELTAVAITTT